MNGQNQNVESEYGLYESWKKANSVAAAVLVLAVLVGLPLIFHNYYYDILVFKYWFYCGAVISVVMSISIIAIIFFRKYVEKGKFEIADTVLVGSVIKTFKVTDWAMIVFFMSAVISTLQSEYRYESFWGNEGRYTGLFLILLYTAGFFIITRCLKFKQWYLDAFLAAGIIVCGLGILHFFKIDPIGFKRQLGYEDYKIFASTIGNINTYTSYVSLLVGASTLLFCVERNKLRKFWYMFAMLFSIFALIAGISDNAYLALMALLGFLPLYLFNNIKGLKNYIIILAIISTEFLVIDYIQQNLAAHVMEINGLFNVVAGFDKLPTIVAFLWAMSIVITILEYWLSKHRTTVDSNIGRWIWLIILFLAVSFILYLLYDANIAGNGDKYSSIKNYIIFNDDWGTHRGYIWRIAMDIFNRFPLIHKLFGYGPDTFGIITVNSYYDEMVALYGEKFDSAHNEYIQYLITIGIVGLSAYMGLIFTSLIRMVHKVKSNPIIMAVPMAIICYSAQAFVNISVPIVAPVMLTLLTVGLAASNE